MKILFIGPLDPRQTSRHVAEALVRLGHRVELCDPYEDLGVPRFSRWAGALHWRTGYHFLQARASRWAQALALEAIAPDLVWVEGGELFGPSVVRRLREAGVPVVVRNPDDPTGPRDALRFRSLRRALPAYDLLAVHARDEVDASEYRAHGVRRVLPIVVGYDEVHHRPHEPRESIDPALRSQVAFVGTWIPGDGRDDFVCRLLELGVPVSIWGNHWQKAPRWGQLQSVWRGPALAGRDYAGALQGAEVALGLLSRANRDGHTNRTNEVPYCGGVLCAQRSAEHERMFVDGEEAVFWQTADECAELCKRLLEDHALRERIRLGGMRRVRANRVGNEDMARQVLDTLFGAGSSGMQLPVPPGRAAPAPALLS